MKRLSLKFASEMKSGLIHAQVYAKALLDEEIESPNRDLIDTMNTSLLILLDKADLIFQTVLEN